MKPPMPVSIQTSPSGLYTRTVTRGTLRAASNRACAATRALEGERARDEGLMSKSGESIAESARGLGGSTQALSLISEYRLSDKDVSTTIAHPCEPDFCIGRVKSEVSEGSSAVARGLQTACISP